VVTSDLYFVENCRILAAALAAVILDY